MNIVDYIIIGILILCIIKGYKTGLISSVINVIGILLVFIIAFYIKNPIADILFKNLPFINFGGIFKGISVANILFYEAIAYGFSIIVLAIIFAIVKKFSLFIDKIMKMTIFLNLPSNICAACVGFVEGLIYVFILLYIGSAINRFAPYVRDSKYGLTILEKTPVLSTVANDLIKSGTEIYDTILKNENNVNQANLESVDILMKYDILSYDVANKLVEDKKLDINGIEAVIEKYKGETK